MKRQTILLCMLVLMTVPFIRYFQVRGEINAKQERAALLVKAQDQKARQSANEFRAFREADPKNRHALAETVMALLETQHIGKSTKAEIIAWLGNDFIPDSPTGQSTMATGSGKCPGISYLVEHKATGATQDNEFLLLQFNADGRLFSSIFGLRSMEH